MHSTIKDPHRRTARWFTLLTEHNFEIWYQAGKNNASEDYLSRPFEVNLVMRNAEMESDLKLIANFLNDFASPHESRDQSSLEEEGKEPLSTPGQTLPKDKERITTGPRYTYSVYNTSKHAWRYRPLELQVNLRIYSEPVLVAESTISNFVRSCDICRKTKLDNREEFQSRIPISGLFSTWPVDFAGSLPRTESGNQYLLVGIEHMSKWPVARAIPHGLFDSLGALKFVKEEMILPFGSPKFILSVNFLKFDCKAIEDFATDRKIQWKHIGAYNPRGNGMALGMVGKIERALQKMSRVSMLSRNLCLDQVQYGYRRPSNTDGKSSFEVLFGVKSRFSEENEASI